MSKRRRGQDNQSQSPCKRSRPAPKKHLYSVIDDWEKGYLRRVNLHRPGPRAPSEPAAFRFVAPASETIFVAMGSNIAIVSSGGGAQAPTLVYDTAAAALAVAPPLPGWISGLNVGVESGAGLPLAFEAFSSRGDRPRSGHGKAWPRRPPPFGEDGTVVSYAVQSDGRTIFVPTRVARGWHRGNGSTYSFDTTRREWRCQGAWVLPFHGQGYFDRELDAWVGLLFHALCVGSARSPSN
ncbi:hypothetical protein SETIT_1G310100v2 [Setaria italica]|uniref:Uncharacterized protein n=1 Tax=Setaria italica TaxID=4555 RepID=K3Z0K8_SETIT|nr:hypothetical protein SETIT_1G310100v2 [Setaria italica]